MKRGYRRQTDIEVKKLMRLINPNNFRILKILEKNVKINQTQLQKRLGVSYRQTQRYVGTLKKVGLIKKRKERKAIGSPVFISLK